MKSVFREYKNTQIAYIYLVISLLCFGTLFFTSEQFIESCLAPKWHFFICTILLSTFIYFSIYSFKPLKKIDIHKCFRKMFDVFFFFLFLLAIYGILQYFGILNIKNGTTIAGTFENTAGFSACLSAGLPFGFCSFLNQSTKKRRRIIVSIYVFILLSILLSFSRAAWIASISIIVFLIMEKKQYTSFKKIAMFFSFLILLILASYLIKKDSANGRLLVWNCSLNMILDRPILGFGTKGFEANYMTYQASYFERNTDSKYSMLADSVIHPFNEYIGLTVSYGIIGLFALFIYICFIIYCYKKAHTIYSYLSLLSLISIGVFAAFSYPFSYPFIIFIFFINSFIIIYDSSVVTFKIKNIPMQLIRIALLFFCTVYGIQYYEKVITETKWCKTLKSSLTEKENNNFDVHYSIKKTLDNNPYFLYNFSLSLYNNKRFEESLVIAKECEEIWSDYDLELLLAENYMKLSLYAEAKKHFLRAHFMCPNRFVPLYKIVLLLDIFGEVSDAKLVAEDIMQKKIKVPSTVIYYIKNEMKKYLENHQY